MKFAKEGRVNVRAVHGTFQEAFKKDMDYLWDHNKQHHSFLPVFAFIDPNGYKLPMDVVKRVMQWGTGEVLVNLMNSFILRFVRNRSVRECINELFGGETWKDV